jgi:hypothetical protein
MRESCSQLKQSDHDSRIGSVRSDAIMVWSSCPKRYLGKPSSTLTDTMRSRRVAARRLAALAPDCYRFTAGNPDTGSVIDRVAEERLAMNRVECGRPAEIVSQACRSEIAQTCTRK